MAKPTRESLLRRAMKACKSDDCSGYCINCGAHRGQCEPDAREYPCEKCKRNSVYGAEELVVMLAC